MRDIKRAILRTLRRHDGLCLDNTEERQILAASLCKLFKSTVNDAFCMSCGHLDEVHIGSECIGGPDTNCYCEGYRD